MAILVLDHKTDEVISKVQFQQGGETHISHGFSNLILEIRINKALSTRYWQFVSTS